MRKKVLILLLTFIYIFTINTYATSELDDTYPTTFNDSVADIVHVEKEYGKINLYNFYGKGCHACTDLDVIIDELKEEYPMYLNVYSFDTWSNDENANLLIDSATQFGYKKSYGVPVVIINDTMLVGYSPSEKESIENIINGFIHTLPVNDLDLKPTPTPLPSNDSNVKGTSYTLPIIGKVNASNVSIPLVAIVLGFIDGFNPCAMWVLLLLISLFLGMKNRKRAWILGSTFLFISALIYFLSMFGINIILDVFNYTWLKNIVSLFIIIAGFINLKKYFRIKNEQAGCTVVDDKKRKNILYKSRNIIDEKNIIISLIGIILLGISVNSLELFCSLGFPMVFGEILSINSIFGASRIAYTLLYVLFYMIDDIVIFLISMITLKATGITNKYNKICTLISSIIMIIIGLLLIFKPAWLMLNF